MRVHSIAQQSAIFQPLLLKLALVVTIGLSFSQTAAAQNMTKKGVLTQSLVRSTLIGQSTTLSQGTLADLQTDPNFAGDYALIVQDASKILDGYTIVESGGYFPENRGIPRSQQLAKIEVVYSIYSLPNSLELFLYRSPTENTARYFIRNKR